jgi:UDP-N-acetylglucosamine/UDP-N-acetylgalactosamine diphosphorylase
MASIPPDLRDQLRRHGQEHVLSAWDRLEPSAQEQLLAQLKSIDFEELAQLTKQQSQTASVPDPSRIQPIRFIPHRGPEDAARRKLGEEELRQGRVAVLLVAGGQGSRLGFDHPKGMYRVGPVSKKCLFQLHSEKVLGRGRRHATNLPFLVMTSPATDAETRAYFRARGHFGLPTEHVHFFCQGTMPAVDAATGRLLMESHGTLSLSPDGHGGTITALAKSGLLAKMKAQGIRHIFYFQVDNPLLKVADPLFLGHHIHTGAEVSSRVIAKAHAKERMGVFAEVDGRCTIIEYSDLPTELAEQTDASGKLRLWAGSPAIHIFDLAFLERITGQGGGLPFHVARKKVPHIDEKGELVQPTKENALKFERFIFDVLPLAERWAVVESLREEEFAPLKNAEGADSPATVHAALVNKAATWLEAAGAKVPLTAEKVPLFPVEISPLFALDAEETARKISAGTEITGPTYFE